MQAPAVHKGRLERYFNSCHLTQLVTDNNTNFEKLKYVHISDICAETFVFEIKYVLA
jgi:hypothetical protein